MTLTNTAPGFLQRSYRRALAALPLRTAADTGISADTGTNTDTDADTDTGTGMGISTGIGTGVAVDCAAGGAVAFAVAETPPPSSSLTVLGQAVIEGHAITFGTRASNPRLWISTTSTGISAGAGIGAGTGVGVEGARVIGYLTGLAAGEPVLWICDRNSWEWANTKTVNTQLKAAATRTWHHCVRTCNG